jgi:choline dehydrogenase-like flavoprotein
MEQQYDYIVIGGGAAGCPLAATLAKRGRTLLLERGPASVQDTTIRTCCNKEAVTWHRTEGGSWAATANVLGGGSSINAGVFIKETTNGPFFEAHPFLDTNAIQQAYAEVTEAVSFERPAPTPIGADLVNAMKHAGLGKEDIDTNTAHYGIYHPHSLFNKQGVRHTAVDLLPKEGCLTAHNLTVWTNICVTRVLFDTSGPSPRATGIEYEDMSQSNSGTQTLLQPQAEYVLSCGAIHTPRLLMLSGVGNANDLAKHDIPIVLDQPHIGQHLKDKAVIATSLAASSHVDQTVLDTMAATPDIVIGTASGGQLATYIGPSVLAMIPKSYRTPIVRQTAAQMISWLQPMLVQAVNQQITIYATLSSPTSEGSVTLSSSDAHASPVIRTAGYQTTAEIEAAAKGLNIILSLVNAPSIAKYAYTTAAIYATFLQLLNYFLPAWLFSLYPVPQPCKPPRPTPKTFPTIPSTDVSTPEARTKLQAWLNEMHAEGWTYTGTCRFDDVVDYNFSVKGVEGLKVVDASVLKRPTRVNQQATMMMLGVYAGRKITGA